MEILWNNAYPGIFINDSVGGTRGGGRELGVAEGAAFVSATRRALDKIASKPIGKDLLSLISKRCQGIGTKLQNGTCTIYYGTGTLVEGRVDIVNAALRETNASGLDAVGRNRTTTPFMSNGVVIPGLFKVGAGSSAAVTYNPFGDYTDTMLAPGISLKILTGVDFPAYIALAHEMVHAFHTLSGNRKAEKPAGKARLEEAWTVGAGKYANTRISENTIRKEHGLPLRPFYSSPGDCS